MFGFSFCLKNIGMAWLAQPAEHATLDLRVVNLSPTLGADYLKKKIKCQKKLIELSYDSAIPLLGIFL